MKPFISINRAHTGRKVVADPGFTCLPAMAVRTIKRDRTGAAFIDCACGRHYLDGQLGYTQETKGRYVGLWEAR